MDLQLSAEDQEFQAGVQAFLAENLSDEIRQGSACSTTIRTEPTIARPWGKIIGEKGWMTYNWSKEYGGPGWDVVKRYIWELECAKAGTPSMNTMGMRMVGPVIQKFGTKEQKEFFLPRIVKDEDSWCQGYSEPGSGSDLASLQTRAESDGDDYIINGTKIWTTGAHYANRMFCLVRTATEGKHQEGISFVLIDMDTPGIKVEPILMMSGDHELNQVFFDDVRIPKSRRVGEENDGWTVAKYLLEFERGGVSYTPSLNAGLLSARRMAEQERDGDGGRLIDDPAFANQLCELEVLVTAAEYTEKRVMSALSQGQNPGPASSMFKLRGSEIGQRLNELKVRSLAYYATPYQPETRVPGNNVEPIGPDYGVTTTAIYLNNRASTIYAGSSEVQRSIIAKRVLNL